MKTKIFIVGAVVLVILLVFVGVRYSDKLLPEAGTVTADTQETTTVMPFVDAQTEVIGGETAQSAEATTKEKTTAKLITSNAKNWPRNKVFDGIPKPDARKISACFEYETVNGKQFIIRFEDYSYSDFLSYIKRLEKAGFSDKNNRYHIPEAEPSGTAMFYYSYDGERSFGVYWHGKGSPAGFDCEIVVCNYDQAK